MGIFSVPITISHPQSGEAAEMMALVDTGASLTIAPASVLRSLRIVPSDSQVFELADGRHVRYEVGKVEITVEGKTVPTLAVFGPDDMDATLGVVVLETAGLTIDPVTPRLIRTDLMMH